MAGGITASFPSLDRFLLTGAFLCAAMCPPHVATAATFVVNSTLDAVDTAPGDGVCATAGAVCTLRAAVQEANALAGADVITLPAGTYTLTIAGAGGVPDAATGDLSIVGPSSGPSDITINGAASATTIVDANAIDRVFHVLGNGSALVLNDLTVRNGNGGSVGGCIELDSASSLTLVRSAVTGCNASEGAGIWGAATVGSPSTLTITDTTISQNISTGSGGGMALFGQGGGGLTTTINRSTISGNVAGTFGGGIYASEGAVTVSNSTISGNMATTSAGAIRVVGTAGSAMTLANVTITSNSSATLGAVTVTGTGQVTARNTIIANSSGAAPSNCNGTITNLGNNVEFPGTPCGFTTGDPKLAPLASNGGFTRTHALGAGSAAVDAGDSATCATAPVSGVDQRGTARSSGAPCDIGAYELVIVPGSPTPTPTPVPAPNPDGSPSISAISNQTVVPGGSVTVSFTVSGTIPAERLLVGASAYDSSLVPTSALTLVHGSGGNWTLTIAAPARTGATMIQVMVDDGQKNSGTTFILTIMNTPTSAPPPATPADPKPPATPTDPKPPGSPSPTALTATSSGSGIQLTWIPAGVSVLGSVIAGGATPGRSEWSVIVPGASATTYVIPMVPPGTYSLRVYGVTSTGLTPASNEASVTAAGSPTVSGPPSGLTAVVTGGDVTLTWTPPAGLPPSMYEVEFGTAPTRGDVAAVLAVTPRYTQHLEPGTYYMRVRARTGAAVSAASNEVSIPVGPAACAAAPRAPLLLPPTVTSGVVTLSWILASGPAADHYRLDVTTLSGAVISLPTSGAGTSLTRPGPVGTYSVAVVALNGCGSSSASNAISFDIP